MSGCMSIAREWNLTSSLQHMRFFSKTRSVLLLRLAHVCHLISFIHDTCETVSSKAVQYDGSTWKLITNVCVSSVIFGQCELGLHWCGWGTSTEEWWLPPLQDHDRLQVQSQASDHRNTTAELPERALVPAALHYAWEVGYICCYL